MRAQDYKIQLYRKVLTNNLNSELNSDFEKNLAKKYMTVGSIKKLLSCAKYLQIQALKLYALVLIGVQVKVDENSSKSVDEICARWNITEKYDMEVDKELKKKYPFLNSTKQN